MRSVSPWSSAVVKRFFSPAVHLLLPRERAFNIRRRRRGQGGVEHRTARRAQHILAWTTDITIQKEPNVRDGELTLLSHGSLTRHGNVSFLAFNHRGLFASTAGPTTTRRPRRLQLDQRWAPGCGNVAVFRSFRKLRLL